MSQYWDDNASQGKFVSGTNDDIVDQLEWNAIESDLKAALSDLNVQTGLSCLEIGCHVGFTSSRIIALIHPARYDGIDISVAAIQAANHFKLQYGFEQADFACASATSIPMKNEAYDVALSIRCLQNICTGGEQLKALEEMHRILKPGGLGLLVENWKEPLERLNSVRQFLQCAPIHAPSHCLFLDEQTIGLRLEHLFETKATNHFASAYYFGTRVAKWLDPSVNNDDLSSKYNTFFGSLTQYRFALRLGPSLMVLRKRA